MGVGSRLHGFSIYLFRNEDVLVHTLNPRYKTKFLSTLGAGYKYFKDTPVAFSDTFCFILAVAFPNMKKKKKKKKKKKMEKMGYLTND